MLESKEQRKFKIICPHCKTKQHPGDFSWLGIFGDLDMFGKTVMYCTNCCKYYIIRDEDEDGPFTTK